MINFVNITTISAFIKAFIRIYQGFYAPLLRFLKIKVSQAHGKRVINNDKRVIGKQKGCVT